MSSTSAVADAVVTTTPAPSAGGLLSINLASPGWLEYGIVIGVVAVLFLAMLFCWCRNKETILLQTADGQVRVLKSSMLDDESLVETLRLSAAMKLAAGIGTNKKNGTCGSAYDEEEQRQGLLMEMR